MKKIMIIATVIAAVIVAAGLLLPKEMRIEREIVINRPVVVVFNGIRSLRNNEAWNPWLKMEPGIVSAYAGPDGKVSSSGTWKGKKAGEGEQEIRMIVENQKIVSELRFKKPMQSVATSYLITEPVGPAQTRVKWGFEGESKFPCNIMSLLLGKPMMVKTFDRGLADLKLLMEKS